ncbi:Ig-like domain-containing protein [Demequina activiva]|uniref:mannan endo-1,4-beta-mannosidase n=1 Tax=Demequina activiva TaxID=1582364 RepID=A0A919UKU8_9MICO|nr:cellulase family glycosylhydrolase [Demequina activiva]GIG55375.1 hypothetical protein Dac01nite_21270 [Demequina activiva]
MSDTTAARTPASARVGVALLVIAALMLVGLIGYGIVNGSGSQAREGFVHAEDGQFMLDGEPYSYASSNAYTLMLESEPGVEVYLKTFQEGAMPVARAWAFLDIGTEDGDLNVEGNNPGTYFQYWDAEAGAPAYNDGPDGLGKLDYLIWSAGERDVKLMLPLVNNWTAFGGIDQYVRWAGLDHHDDFFTDETIRGWYKDWVTHLLNRVNPLTGIAYKDDPTIMLWEIGNELRCSDSGPYPSSDACGSDMIVAWAQEMAAHVKSIDPDHMVGFGGEGFLCTEPDSEDTLFNCTESADPVALLEDPNIDAHGIHVYPNHWEPTTPTDDWEEWGAWWIEQHGQIAEEAGKPYYIGEYGWIDQFERMAVFDHWLQTFYDAGGDGSHFWIMQPEASIAAPTDSVGFTQKCPGPACDLVGNWTRHVRDGEAWESFAPLAETDYATTTADAPVTVNVLANDKVYAEAGWDEAGLDLDTAAAGVQSSVSTEDGTFEASGGEITFTPAPGASGTVRATYTAMDANGLISGEARLSITVGD